MNNKDWDMMDIEELQKLLGEMYLSNRNSDKALELSRYIDKKIVDTMKEKLKSIK